MIMTIRGVTLRDGQRPRPGKPHPVFGRHGPRPASIRAFKNPTIVLLACLLASLSCLADAQKIRLPPVTRTTWDNGVRLVLMEYHRASTLTVHAIFPGGEKLDPPDKTGAVSLMTELLKKGTESRTAPQIAEAVDFLGGDLSTNANDEGCTISLDVLEKDADTGLDLMADIIRHPIFPQAELDREKNLEVSQLQSMGENPAGIASYVLTQTMYGSHPYGRQSSITSLQAISREDILAAYQKAFAPDHMILVAVGDFKSSDMQAKLRARFGDWARANVSLMPTPPVPAAPVHRVLIDKPDATQTQVRLARTGFPRRSPDYFAAQLADTILGGGFTSRLVDEIRVNRSLTYGISSSFPTQKAGGLFEVSTFTKIETTRALLDATGNVLAKAVKQGISETEYRKAQGYLAGQFAIHVQTPEALAGQLGEMAFYNLPDNYLETYLARLRAVPLSDVNRIARTYFSPNALSVVLVAPAAKIKIQLNGLGDFDIRPVESVGK